MKGISVMDCRCWKRKGYNIAFIVLIFLKTTFFYLLFYKEICTYIIVSTFYKIAKYNRYNNIEFDLKLHQIIKY